MKTRIMKYITIKLGDNIRAVMFHPDISHIEVAKGFGFVKNKKSNKVLSGGFCEIIMEDSLDNGDKTTVRIILNMPASSIGLEPADTDSKAILRSITNGPHDYFRDHELEEQ